MGWLASGGGLGGGGRVGLGLRLGGGVLTGGVGAVQGLVLTATYLFSVWAGASVVFLVVVVVVVTTTFLGVVVFLVVLVVVVVAGRRVLGGGVGLSYLLLGVVLDSGWRLGGSGSRPGPLVGEGLDVQDGVESDLM